MRSITAMASCALLALPLVSLPAPARADNDFMGQAKKFFNNDNDRNAYERGNANDRNAYDRGRDDELSRQQAERDRDHHYRPDRDSARTRDERYRDSNNRYDYR
jgi:hypothetical protein